MAEAMLDLAAAGVDVLRLDAVPFLWKRVGTNCQNQPEVHELLQAFRAAMRIAAPGGRLQGRGDRRAARPRRLPRHRPPRGQGVRPRLPQRAHGAAVERARLRARRADDAARCAAMPPVPPGAGWVTYVRCHDDIGWAITDEDAGAGRARTRTCTAASWPTSTPASSRARSRAARASSPTRGPARRARAAPRPRWRGSRRAARRRARRSSWRSAACCCCTRVAFAYGGLPLIYMGDELGLRNDAALGRRPAHARRQPLDAPAARWTGRPPRAATTRRPSRAGCGPGCGGSSRPAGRPARCTPRARRAGLDGQRPRLRAAAASTRATALLRARELHRRPAGVSLDVDRSRGFELTGAPSRARRPGRRGLPRLHHPRALPAPLVSPGR